MISPDMNAISPPGTALPGPGLVQAPQRVQAIVRTGPAPSGQAPASGVPNAVELLKALRRRWLLATTLGLLCAGAAGVALWSIVPPAEYRAQTRLNVASTPPRIIFQTAEARVDFPTFQRTQLAMIKSQLVLNEALRNLSDLEAVRSEADPVRWLEEEIQANFDGEILRISMSSTRPAGLARIVNAVRDAYLSEVVDVEKEQRKTRHEELKKIYDDYQKKLAEQRATLESLAKSLGSSDAAVIKTTHELALERRFLAERELQSTQTSLRKARIELKVMLQQQRGGSTLRSGQPSQSLIEDLIREDPGIRQLVDNKARLQQEYRLQSRKYRNPSQLDPTLRTLSANIAKEQEAIEARTRELRTYFAANPPRQKEGGIDYSDLRQRIAILEEQEAMLAQDVATLAKETDGINENSIDLESIKAEIEKMNEAADRVGAEVEALSVELNAPSRVQKLEDAGEPRPESDKRLRMAGMGGVGTFALVLLGVSWLEIRTRRIDSVHEVTHGLGLPIMGALPPNGRPRRQLSQKKPTVGPVEDRLLVESIDAVRTLLLHAMRMNAVRSIMVTSAVAGEGKSSLACHLAVSIARASRRTLLIDGDLRNPTLHRVFDQLPEPGLSEVLRGQVGLDEVIRPTGANGLWMIPAGQWDRRAVEALTLDGSREIFDRLKADFDFVVIDTSPILPVTDALLIGQHVDAAVYSIRREFSRVPQVQAAYERLTRLGIRVLGAVVAGVPAEAFSGDYKYQGAADA